MSSPEPLPASFWQPALADLQAQLGSSPEGLSEAEAEARRRIFGSNQLRPHAERAWVQQFLAHFKNPLVLVLLAASAIAGMLGDMNSFIVISVIVLMSVTLDFFQEFRASRAVEKLRHSVALRARVVRGGQTREIPVAELVPGDVVLLAAGDLAPADGRVLDARDLFVNQALLTGESYPVEKHAQDALPDADMASATNALFLGTSVISGAGRLLIVRTGSATALGQIADTLVQRPQATAFERGTQAFGALILRLTVILVLAVLLINAAFHRPLFESFLFAVALAVGLTPELLPMVLSVTLSQGAMRLARRRVIVKRLSAVQELGGIDVLCTDKTGTLTEGHIRLERHVDALGRDSERVLELAYLNSQFETGIRSPLDEAILAHTHIDVGAWRKVDEVPFDFERRRVSVLLERGGARSLFVKGSPEDVLRLCTRYEDAEAQPSLDDAARERILALFEELSRDGFRVLGIAWRQAPPHQAHAVVTDESELVFCGFAAFLDPPKASAAPALAALAAGGVAVKIVSGDNELVARYICDKLGVPITGVLNGSDIQAMSDPALHAQVERVTLFCRVTPAQKTRILNALRARGHVVGFLGDGINDAPALHAANVGISVDSAVDVAKEAADLVLLEHDLNVLQEGVREGRRTFGNVTKYIMMGTSSNFGNMFSMAGGTLFLPFLPMLPIQILLNNFLYDLSEIAIPLDRVDEDTLARPRVWDMHFIRNFMLALGPVSSVFDFLTFFVMLKVFQANEALFHTGWFIESIATQVLVIFIIRTRGSPFASRPNVWLVALSLAVVAVAALLPWLPFAGELGFVAPPPALYAALAGIVAAYLAVMFWAKRMFYRRWERRSGRAR
ncbi:MULTISPECIES: magnesium-translocating P-type ATPase [unclassified Thiobacillus]|uniref:magnesium-translocating P-type ATPase n=1 Tax=unclassified Thiobacillus TaxID=2646513 RepID=UPI00086EA9CC|nr:MULTISPECIES: magnesium-translocating P-type ATPase [unclassified Thiobacillus]MBN8780707.1 magnesium-translocating P-type ATPase [Thiobacillus sp.]ODV02642.1 MAG: magnesium-translocating P-type ATPase [Thiobacillus sp. SCN 63-57]OJY57879.1 MAG: magnesium-translocating P-type ATPase [Thiobacillus sp. 0-1251]